MFERDPDALRDSYSRRARRARVALGCSGDGFASRLLSSVNELWLYSLHTYHLDLSEVLALPQGLYDPATVTTWKQSIGESFSGPLWWRLEGGKRLHVHILADRDDGPAELPRGGEIVKKIHHLEGLLRYLGKPAMPATDTNRRIYLEARARAYHERRRLPRTSGTMRVPSRRTWQPPVKPF